jgi:phosphoribosylformylglycinamidine synthase PurS subunit
MIKKSQISPAIIIYLSDILYLHCMIYTAEINVMPLKELLDPQGKAVEHGLHNLGFNTSNVRIGKHITLKIEADSKDAAIAKVDEACKKLLHNQVMEYYEFVVSE